MLLRLHAIILRAALAVLLLTTSASAECAWVLWTQTKDSGWRGWWSGPRWVADSAYTSKEACDNAHVIRWARGQDGKPVAKDAPYRARRGLGPNWPCLPA